MLNLVDYEGSDSEDEVGDDAAEECIHAEVVTIPKKAADVVTRPEVVNGDVLVGDRDYSSGLASGSSTGILASLPSTSTSAMQQNLTTAEGDLEDIVKRKGWELKAARKAEKKKRKLEKLRKKEKRKLEKGGSITETQKATTARKKIRIEAFGGLKGLEPESDEDAEQNPSSGLAKDSERNLQGLLSMLPVPKSEARSNSKSATILLPAALRSQKPRVEVKKVPSVLPQPVQSVATVSKEDSEDEDEPTDFFGLNSAEDEGSDDNIGTTISHVAYGPSKPVAEEQMAYGPQFVETDYAIVNEVGPSTSGTIDDSEAARLIYSHDVAPLGGVEKTAAMAVDGIVDVSVDQALGPNVRGNLLKNLHNKSLAEAAISHLANIPKPKDAKDMVARRKHQITYLATVAVAREEQLAEEWSQNRQTKRMSAQKYGF